MARTRPETNEARAASIRLAMLFLKEGHPMIFKTLGTIAAILFATLSSPALSAQIVDAAGRTVKMDLPAKRVILGEARQVHVARR